MITVRAASASDVDVVAGIFAEAFRDDPAWAMFFPRAESRQAKLRRYYRRAVRRRPERVDVARSGVAESDGTILGAMLWTPPGKSSPRGPAAWIRRATMIGVSVLRRVASGRARRNLEHARAIKSFRPTEPHWYLTDIASDPQARGLGVGSALLGHRLQVIDDADALPVFLESTTAGSRRLYERFGFRAVGTVETQPGQASTAMIRPAR